MVSCCDGRRRQRELKWKWHKFMKITFSYDRSKKWWTPEKLERKWIAKICSERGEKATSNFTFLNRKSNSWCTINGRKFSHVCEFITFKKNFVPLRNISIENLFLFRFKKVTTFFLLRSFTEKYKSEQRDHKIYNYQHRSAQNVLSLLLL